MGIKDFRDLIAWQKANDLVIGIYKNTENFPKSELFGLTSQIRRASVSITSNIAEGFGRRTAKDRLHFYDISRSSIVEVQSQLIIAEKLEFIKKQEFDKLWDKTVECNKIFSGLMNTTK